MTIVKKILFIGPLGGGETPKNGASIKNRFIVDKLREGEYKVNVIDTEHWRSNPFILIKVLIKLLISFKSKIIISTSFYSAYRILKIASKIVEPQRIYYWVIGGALAEKIKEYNLSPDVYKKIKFLIVEGKSIESELGKIGIRNIVVLPNFKKIGKLPEIPKRVGDKIKFVFLSRIRSEKGCDLILEACKQLNAKGFEKKYSVDFYGPIEESYKTGFLTKVNDLNNIEYRGFLNLQDWDNYEELAKFDCLLFPTFWPTEGFPGIIVDAMVSGLPVMASNWNMNKEIVQEGVNGWLIEPNDLNSLYHNMESLILNPERCDEIRGETQKKVHKFDIDNLLTPEYLKSLGF